MSANFQLFFKAFISNTITLKKQEAINQFSSPNLQ